MSTETKKDMVVWQENTGTGNVIGTALDLFEDCTFTFHANPDKRVCLIFKNPKGQRASVILSKSLMPVYEAGELNKSSILKLPIYHSVVTQDDGTELNLMIAGKPETKGYAVKDINADKIKEYQPIVDDSFDDAF